MFYLARNGLVDCGAEHAKYDYSELATHGYGDVGAAVVDFMIVSGIWGDRIFPRCYTAGMPCRFNRVQCQCGDLRHHCTICITNLYEKGFRPFGILFSDIDGGNW